MRNIIRLHKTITICIITIIIFQSTVFAESVNINFGGQTQQYPVAINETETEEEYAEDSYEENDEDDEEDEDEDEDEEEEIDHSKTIVYTETESESDDESIAEIPTAAEKHIVQQTPKKAITLQGIISFIEDNMIIFGALAGIILAILVFLFKAISKKIGEKNEINRIKRYKERQKRLMEENEEQ